MVSLKEVMAWVLAALSASIILALVFIEDFRFFAIPPGYALKLYVYAALGMIAAAAVIIGLSRYEGDTRLVGNSAFKFLACSFGFLWIIDGIMQLQPEMSFGFVSFVASPAIQASPVFVIRLLSPAETLWSHFPILLDALSGVLQLLIGIGMIIFWSRSSLKIFLLLSFAWAIFLWIFGEAFGGIFTADSSYLTGFPGSALVYAAVSILLLMYKDTGKMRLQIALFMAAIMAISALIQALPSHGFWNAENLFAIPSSVMINQQPFILSLLLHSLSLSFYYYYIEWNVFLVGSMAASSVLWVLRPRIGAIYTAVFSLFVWFAGQDFGVLGGYGTDPNTALPIVILAIAYLIGEKNVFARALKQQPQTG